MKIEHVLVSSNTQKLLETCHKLAFTPPIVVGRSGLKKILDPKIGLCEPTLRKSLLIDDHSRGNSKQSGYVRIHERAEKIVEGTVDEFCLIFSSIKAVSAHSCFIRSFN